MGTVVWDQRDRIRAGPAVRHAFHMRANFGMSTPEPASVQPAARRRRSPAVILARVVAYFVAAWTTIAVLAAGLFPGALWMTLAVAAYFILPLIVFLRWRGWPFYPSAAFRLLIVRPFLYANLMLPLVAGAGLIGALGGALFGHALVAGRAFALVVLVATAIFLVIGYIGSRSLVVRHVDAFVPELPPSFDGLKIGQLSDLHVGPHTSRRFIDQVVRATHALAPDLIAITGDLIDDRAEDVAVYAELLGSLAAPLGVFMIPGNHDVYAGWDDVEEALRRAQLGTVLVNEAHIIRRGGDAIVLVAPAIPRAAAEERRGPRPTSTARSPVCRRTRPSSRSRTIRRSGRRSPSGEWRSR